MVLSSPSQLVDPLTFNVLGINGSFRESSVTEFFNPTNTTAPFFQVFDSEFLQILGPNATIRAIAANPGFAFAHEAPIWVPETDEVFFASQDGGALGFSDVNHNNQVSKISLSEVAAAIEASDSSVAPVNVSVTKIDLPEAVQMTNGGTGPFFGRLVFVNSGRGSIPPSLVLVDPKDPSNTTVLLDNFFGRQFNSLNDIKIHPRTGKFFFTDVTYGFLNHFRPLPLLPNQVYRFDPDTGSVRVVADGFDRCNGVAFSPDGSVAFVTDTGLNGGFLGNNQTAPATIYAFDVDPRTNAFANRRVFAYVDTGIADGIQLDGAGNVYAGCGDGAQASNAPVMWVEIRGTLYPQVWNSEGTLLGKFFLGTVSANLIFAGDGRLVILAETAVYFANIAAKFNNVSYP
ncbi:calcium-dependent phosphotriesterase [Dichomitus squalens]|uniref:Calcium-dependent phosphotriesterase n=1 Tax=Dichomitus squalens TaxID=114155 RepID=A0A4V2JZ68_9APHY|nr:calcium-dependent phosphotriesterase [Dichomitus squalens]TBU43165.1 calcium-dependent phosphotriesterase [Dichomitus squalens]